MANPEFLEGWPEPGRAESRRRARLYQRGHARTRTATATATQSDALSATGIGLHQRRFQYVGPAAERWLGENLEPSDPRFHCAEGLKRSEEHTSELQSR